MKIKTWALAATVGASVAMHGASGDAQTGLSVAGQWNTQFAGPAALVVLTQAGPNVVGTYVNSPPLAPGALAGIMRGNVLTGRWTDAGSSGGFTLTFSPDGRSFTGTWGRTLESTSNGGPWVGRR